MFFRNLTFFLLEALKNFRTNFYLHLAVILIICISFFIFGTVLIFEENIEKTLSSISRELTLEVFLKDDVNEISGDFLKLKRFVATHPVIKSFRYISRPDAYLEFKKHFKEYEGLVENMDENPFPASFQVVLKEGYANTEEMVRLISAIEKSPSVEDLSFNKDWLNRFFSFISLVRMSVWLTVFLIGVGLVLIIHNGIKLTIHSKSSQIEIMKLVGASNWFIRGQFIFEGIIECLLGTCISILVLYLAYKSLFEKISNTFSFIFPQHYFSFLSVNYMTVMILSGVFLGLLGGILSTSKFLKN